MTKQTEPAEKSPTRIPDNQPETPRLRIKTSLRAGFVGDVPRTG